MSASQANRMVICRWAITRELLIKKGLHSGQFLLGAKAHFCRPQPQKMLVAGVFTLILVPAMFPWM